MSSDGHYFTIPQYKSNRVLALDSPSKRSLSVWHSVPSRLSQSRQRRRQCQWDTSFCGWSECFELPSVRGWNAIHPANNRHHLATKISFLRNQKKKI